MLRIYPTMKLEEFRREMESYRRSVDEEAQSLKDSYMALEMLHALYQKFDAQERAMADKVLAEWVLSDDESLRFDALALIDDFKIETAVPALSSLAARLALGSAPGAPHVRLKVIRIIDGLGGSAHTQSND